MEAKRDLFLRIHVPKCGGKHYLSFGFLFLGILFLWESCSSGKRVEVGPNVLLITMDTTRFDYFSYVLEKQKTSEISRLAQEGVFFDHVVTSINSTNPSHLSIFTSQYPSVLGVHSNSEKYTGSYPTMAEILGREKYRTAAAVAAYHLGNPKYDILKGFEEKVVPRGDFKAAKVTDLAIRWLSQTDAQKFFLWIHYFDPHAVYTPPKEFTNLSNEQLPPTDRNNGAPSKNLLESDPFFEKSGFNKIWKNWLQDSYTLTDVKKLYMGEVLYMIREMERLLQHFRNSKFSNNTLIVLVADHGESLGEHAIYFDHMGLYEQQVKVPMIFYFPEKLASGKMVHDCIETIDILPTTMELLEVPLQTGLTGKSFASLITPGKQAQKPVSEKVAIIENSEMSQISARSEEWKLILPLKKDKVLDDEIRLFNLKQDPQEQTNVLNTRAHVAAKLKEILMKHMKISKEGLKPELSEEERENLRSLGYVDE